MGHAMYRVYYLNNFLMGFHTRDEALDWVLKHSFQHNRPMGDYEILDSSDL